MKVFIGFILISAFSAAIYVSGEYTKAEKNALAQFRPMVKNLLLEDYMSTDEYLIPWLRTKKLDLEEAKKMLANAMTWRKDNKINQILTEDFSKFRKDYPVFQEGSDKEGRPITTYLIGLYDFRKITIAGETDAFHRYLNRNFEHTSTRIRELGQQNITDHISVFDLYGFNRRQHLCLQCLSIYAYFVRTYEAYYPEMSFKTYFVNMPTLFEQVLTVIRPLFSEHTRDSIFFLGLNKEEWRKELLKQIPSDQLYRQFGGTKIVKPGTEQ